MTEFQATSRKNEVSARKFKSWASSVGIDLSGSSVIVFPDSVDPSKIEKLVITPDPSSADQRAILGAFGYLQKGLVTADTP
jgi:hypothetical protein